MANTNTNPANMIEIDYEFVNTMRIYYPALYLKSSKAHSNRDIVSNSWTNLSKRMGDITVEAAKDWWNRLLRDYRTEKVNQQKESRSGSGAQVKRERFHLYDLIKDMLSTSEASKPSTNNYTSNCVENENQEEEGQEKQQQQLHLTIQKKEEYYSFKRASGRSGRKKLEVTNVVQDMNDTILNLQKAVQMKRHAQAFDDTEESPNKEIGDLIFCELQRMNCDEAARNRAALLSLDVILNSSTN